MSDLMLAFNKKYKKRLDKIKESVKAYVEKYGPVVVVSQIEKKVWEQIKESERERKRISEGLRRRIEELTSRFKPLGEIEEKDELFKDKLYEIERDILSGEKPEALGSIESEKDSLLESYREFERELAAQVEAIEKERKELEARKSELEKAEAEYRIKAEEEKQRLVESELNEVERLRSELLTKEQSLQEEKKFIELKRT